MEDLFKTLGDALKPEEKKDFVAGIVCDNYKVERYKEEIEKAEYTFTVKPSFINNTSQIMVTCKPEDVKKIGKLCQRLEIIFQSTKRN